MSPIYQQLVLPRHSGRPGNTFLTSIPDPDDVRNPGSSVHILTAYGVRFAQSEKLVYCAEKQIWGHISQPRISQCSRDIILSKDFKSNACIFSRSMHRRTSTHFSPLFDKMEEVSPEASHRSRAHAAPREREAYGHNHRPAVAPSHSPMPIHSDTLSLHNIF